jgi:hypothetical protein
MLVRPGYQQAIIDKCQKHIATKSQCSIGGDWWYHISQDNYGLGSTLILTIKR